MSNAQREVKVEPKYCENKGCGRPFFREVGSDRRDCETCSQRGCNRALRRLEVERKLPARVTMIDRFKHVM